MSDPTDPISQSPETPPASDAASGKAAPPGGNSRRRGAIVTADTVVDSLARWTAWIRDRRRMWATEEILPLGQLVLPALDRLTGIVAGLLAMLMVDHYHGPAGLGLFAWFFSLLSIAGYIGQYGIPLAVENRLARGKAADNDLPARALAALLALGGVAILVGSLAAMGAPGPGQAATDMFFYLVLGPTVLLRNINALRLAMLNGRGRHTAAAGLKLRQRIAVLITLLILCKTRLPVPFLAAAFLVGQLVMLAMGRKAIRLPAMRAVLNSRSYAAETIENGRAFLFADNLLEVVFYLDMLVLGWFAGPVTLGVYARALILVRLFLVLPAAWRPIFRRQANRLAGAGSRAGLRRLTGRAMRLWFVLHGLAAIFILLHFARIMRLFFGDLQAIGQVFDLFAIILPGLIFFSAITALEPVFEADGETDRLKRMIATVALVNLVLNLNLIPFAGSGGAALATALAMFIYFILFCRRLPGDLSASAIGWPGAAAAVYLTYMPLAHRSIAVSSSYLLVPLIFGGLLWMAGFFQLSMPTGNFESTSPDRPSPGRMSRDTSGG